MGDLGPEQLLEHFACCSYLARVYASLDKLLSLGDWETVAVKSQVVFGMDDLRRHFAARAEQLRSEILRRLSLGVPRTPEPVGAPRE